MINCIYVLHWASHHARIIILLFDLRDDGD